MMERPFIGKRKIKPCM